MSERDFDEAAWRDELEGHRAEKDEFFADHPQSPIPRDERGAFDGLDYYDPDPGYRVEATVDRVPGEDTIEIERTAGDTVAYDRVAELRFELGGEELTLTAYRNAEEPDASLFVPFRDATSGGETYGAGRYLEFEVDGRLEDGATVTVDFNLAYSPFCAYNEAFTCPLPPTENWLEVPVEAGEKHEGDLDH